MICRFRPENETEIKKGSRSVIELPEESDQQLTATIDEKEYPFSYDKIFKPFSTQDEVYDRVGKRIVEGVIRGYNGAVIAYGQTGSGKTHTILGPGFDGNPLPQGASADPGILPRMLRDLFAGVLANSSSKVEFEVRASYIEIYRELVKDLLAPGSVREMESLKIRSDTARGLHLPQATEVPISTVSEAMTVLQTGSEHRKTAETRSNKRSSRSHSIFLVTVFRREEGFAKVSQLYCVDLAGSERVSKSQLLQRPPDYKGTIAQWEEAKELRLREGQKINQSLLALGAVIFALATKKRGQTSTHVPYRNSKLTRLLQNCIGGNARTSMVICCSTAAYNAQETLQTLRFGQRASQIKNAPKINKHYSIKELKALLAMEQQVSRRLRARLAEAVNENKVLREIREFEDAEGVVENRGTAVSKGGVETSKTDSKDGVVMESGEDAKVAPSDQKGEVARKLFPYCTDSGHKNGEPLDGKARVNVGTVSPATHEEKQHIKSAVVALTPMKQRHARIKRPGIRELVVSFLCPLSKEVMVDPVIAMDGHTYNRRAIEIHMRSHSISPMTGNPMQRLLIPNLNLKAQMKKYYPNAKKRKKLSPFSVISISAMALVFSFLEPRWCCACAMVCREFREVSADGSLWRAHIYRDFGEFNPKLSGAVSSFKAWYKVRAIEEARKRGGRRQRRGRSTGVTMVPQDM